MLSCVTQTTQPLPRHMPDRIAAMAGSHRVRCYDENGSFLGELSCPEDTQFVQLVAARPATPPPGSLRDRLARAAGGHIHRLAQICTQACPAYGNPQTDIPLP